MTSRPPATGLSCAILSAIMVMLWADSKQSVWVEGDLMRSRLHLRRLKNTQLQQQHINLLLLCFGLKRQTHFFAIILIYIFFSFFLSQTTSVVRTVTHSAFGGLISSRDFIDVTVTVDCDEFISTNGKSTARPWWAFFGTQYCTVTCTVIWFSYSVQLLQFQLLLMRFKYFP